MDINKKLPEACNWYLDGCEGWFVSCVNNILYKYHIQKRLLSIISFVPTKNTGPYQYPFCVKQGDLVYCFPEFGSSIWCYHLISRLWKEIYVCESKKDVPAMLFLLGKYKEVYYFFSSTTKSLYGMDLNNGIITESYSMDVDIACAYYIHGTLDDGKVYLVFGGTSVYEFDLETHCQKSYHFPDVDDILFRMEADRDFLWFVGKKEKVYLWKKGENRISSITDFPVDIVLYDFEKKLQISEFDENANGLFVFDSIHCLNEKIWLIPLSASKILYFSKNDRVVRSFDIADEEETEETLDMSYRRVACRFSLMYIRKERYLGIYSYRNKKILEIDTLKMTCQKADFTIDQYSLAQIPIQVFLETKNELMNMIYAAKIKNISVSDKAQRRITGQEIYEEIMSYTALI